MRPFPQKMHPQAGFTLAELLIALAILGVIATFTIPKVLQAQQSAEANAKAKECIAMATGAIDVYKLRNSGTLPATFATTDLTPYMNYVALETSGSLNNTPGTTGTVACAAVTPCLLLHNGAKLRLYTGQMGGTDSSYGTWFWFDPDGVVTDSASTADTPGKMLIFFIYANGKVRTYGTIDADTHFSVDTYQPTPSRDPSWFSWSN